MGRLAVASDLLRYGVEELKLIRSLDDVRSLGEKVAYKLPHPVRPYDCPPWAPPSIEIEPTNLCNLRCVTCPGSRSIYPRGFMDMDLFRRIIGEAATIGVKRVHLFLRGEPTLHPHIFEMVAYVKDCGLPIHLTTNGMTLTPERNAQLLDAGMTQIDQVTVSFIGHSRESHEATMRGVDHEKVVANVTDLIRQRRERGLSGPIIETILNPTPENRHEWDDFHRFWKERVDHARLGGVSLSFAEYKREAVENIHRTSRCSQVYYRMPVTWDGLVPQCVMDFDGDRIVGDLKKDSIMDTWNSERMREIRRLHQERRFETLPACLHCDM
jgi:MoaA/NifB/PqqE/SkfB family radical SAM enzyme